MKLYKNGNIIESLFSRKQGKQQARNCWNKNQMSKSASEKTWYFQPSRDDLNQALSRDLDIHPLIARIITNRGFENLNDIHQFLYPKLTDLRDPFMMKDMTKAVEKTLDSIANHDKIIIYGDYDVDGITSIALISDVLRVLGADSDFYLPNRITQGYGLSNDGIDNCISMGARLLISVDCGVNSLNEATYAKAKGLDLIITDHHEPAEELPNCIALLNPKRKDTDYPFKDLAGVGVAFKFAQGLIHLASERKMLAANTINIKEMLDLVALGTVADVVPLIDENRIFVKYGIRQINKTDRIGLKELKAVASVAQDVNSSDIAFKLAPRLNAVGRLGDARHAVKLLTSEDEQEAFNLATMMEKNNRVRQNIESEILEEADEMIEETVNLNTAKTIILHSPKWHQGVIGIVASRIAKMYYKPALIISSMEGDTGKGSGRSIEEFDLLDGLRQCGDLLDTYGGHRLAAGFQIKMANFKEFSRRLEQIASDKLSNETVQPKIVIDAEVQLSEITSSFIKDLDALEPFGNGNSRPVFCTRNLFLTWAPKIVGNNHLKLWFDTKDGVMEGMAFSKGDMITDMNYKDTSYDIVYLPRLNYFRGEESVQLFIRDIRPSKGL
jgi:single-stranded-DNA-specific exonuclease